MELTEVKNSLVNLSKHLNLEIELFDMENKPVFGVAKELTNCQVIRTVYETKNKFLLLHSRKHFLCSECKENCPINSGMFIPLCLQGFSVFSLLACTTSQQNTLLNNQESFVKMAQGLADLLSYLAGTVTLCKADYPENSNKQVNNYDFIIGKDPILQVVKEQTKKIAVSNSTVLITGETGTGKELFAKAVHDWGPRSKHPFIAVNCGAIPEALLESELFGYAPGSFTGASRTGKKGKFELADKGTIFLDEIGDMPYTLQQKLLRALETKTIDPVGAAAGREVDVRVVAATNQNLRELIKQGKFRQDLYYRLNVLSIKVPPLRVRKKDIPLLTSYFMNLFCRELKKENLVLSPAVKELFSQYRWPGNIRELKNVIEYTASLADNYVIDVSHLPMWFWEHLLEDEEIALEKLPIDKLGSEMFLKMLQSSESSAYLKKLTLQEKKLLANKLGVSIATLYRRLKIN